jgi:hypothetical protein
MTEISRPISLKGLSSVSYLLWLSDEDFLFWSRGVLKLYVFVRRYRYTPYEVVISTSFIFTDILWNYDNGFVLFVTNTKTMALVKLREYLDKARKHAPPATVSYRANIIDTNITGGCPFSRCFLDLDGKLLQAVVTEETIGQSVLSGINIYKPMYRHTMFEGQVFLVIF